MLTYGLAIYRGDSYAWTFTLWQDAAKTDPVDLTGVTVASELHQDSTRTHLACTVNANAIAITLPHAQSQTLTTTRGRWDLQLTYASGIVQTIVKGDVSVTADVTGAAV